MKNYELLPQVHKSDEIAAYYKHDTYLGAVAVLGSAHDVYLRSIITKDDTIVVQSGPRPDAHKTREVPLSMAQEEAKRDGVLRRALELHENHVHARQFAEHLKEIMAQHDSGLMTNMELLHTVADLSVRRVDMLTI